MNTETIDKPYIITYSNHFVFEGKTFAFRKKELFDISGIPSLIERTEQGWWIGRKLLEFWKCEWEIFCYVDSVQGMLDTKYEVEQKIKKIREKWKLV
jgi:hypothetical protein